MRSHLSGTLLRLRKRVRHRLRSGSMPTRAAFLVGSGRSGTDVAAVKVGSSLDVILVNEHNPVAFENWRLRDLAVVDRLLERSFAPVLLFKPIVETYRIRELLDHFSGSRALFLSRNPFDSVNSMNRFFGERTREVVERWIESDFTIMKSWTVPPEVAAEARDLYGDGVSLPEAAGIYWLVYNAAFEALELAGDPRVMLVLYEDFVGDPHAEIRRICRHLEVPFRPSMSAGVFRSSVGRHARPELRPSIERACERVWGTMQSRREATRDGRGHGD